MQELPDAATVRTDFDQLALIVDETWDHNNHYYPFLLKHIAQHCHEVLEIGCGIGELARLLAKRADRVLALDLAPEMVRRASELSTQYPNITFQVGDVQEQQLQPGRFDAILSVATIHHLPLEAMLRQMKEALAPGGTLAILDLYQAQMADIPLMLLASPINFVIRPIKTGRLFRSKEARAAWEAHSVHDHFLTLNQIRLVSEQVLPGARVTRHLFWRYSLLWEKPQ